MIRQAQQTMLERPDGRVWANVGKSGRLLGTLQICQCS